MVRINRLRRDLRDLGPKTQHLAAVARHSVSHSAAETKQAKQQLVAGIKQSLGQLSSKAKGDAQQLVGKLEQSFAQSGIVAGQDERQLIAGLEQSLGRLAAQAKQGEKQIVATIRQLLSQLADVAKVGENWLLQMPAQPVVYGMYKNYRYDETSDAWKEWCLPLPCGPFVQFPGYASAWFNTQVNGVTVLVQLWKGRCERLLGKGGRNISFPGGVGAEVGIYIQLHPGDNTWYPAPWVIADFQLPRISWRLINPKTNTVYLEAPEETTYWRNRWMTMQSYREYTENCGGQVPLRYIEYILSYTIDGRQFPPWPPFPVQGYQLSSSS